MPHKNANTATQDTTFPEALAELKGWFDGLIPLAADLLAAHRHAHAVAKGSDKSNLYPPMGVFMDRLASADGIASLQSAVSELLTLAQGAAQESVK